jgi:hypothetical protein
MHQPYAHAYQQVDPQQRTMADLWNEFPAEPGQLAHAVSATLAPTHVGPVMGDIDGPTARPRPYVDPLPWLLLKHLVQLALVGSVLLFVLSGGKAPMMALSYVGTGLLLMGVIVLADRQRFLDRDPAFEIVEFIPAPPRPVEPTPAVPASTLAPMVDLMHQVLPERIEVS